jgi:hypothetical protein
MTRITIDEETRKKLLNCTRPLELCNEAGVVLARLTPSTQLSDSDDWIELGPSPTDEEVERIMDGREPKVAHEELVEKIKQLQCSRFGGGNQ